jgi:hypothetical protein
VDRGRRSRLGGTMCSAEAGPRTRVTPRTGAQSGAHPTRETLFPCSQATSACS